ncbi:MAG TPA: methylenetetrahydrofolate reductase [Nitrososphaerales archaeon]|nr:methylenetetrahydrofolate reductase [Nitrososphaerales archaeon]
MRLAERLERGIFTTVVEIFPPNFNAETAKEPLLGLRQKTQDILARVKKVENLADCVLIADMKDLGRLKLSSIYTAAMLKQELDTEVIPVIAVRDSNRSAVRTLFLSALSYGLDSVMLVWGDSYKDGEGSSNVYDYPSLSIVIREMRELADRADVKATILAPVNIAALGTKKGDEMATSRLKNGADCLLAQPPTSDVSETLPGQLKTLEEKGLKQKVLLNVFPFRDKQDIESCRQRFNWRIPEALERMADEGGEARLLKESRCVVEKLRNARLPGVYVSTRGRPELARFILD